MDKGHSSPQQTVRRAHYLRVFLRALINANLDMARRVLSPPLPSYDLFDFLANEETRRKRELEQIWSMAGGLEIVASRTPVN